MNADARPCVSRCLTCCLFAVAAAVCAPAQAPAPPSPPAHPPAVPNDASKQLHAAWLREVLDLDVPSAITAYQTLAQDHRPAHIERWIAIARLAELERAGLRIEPKPALADAPAAIRPAFAALTPIPVAELLQRAGGDPAQLLQAAGTETGRIPTMRPVTPNVQQWVRDQIGPSLRDRARARDRIQNLTNRPRTDSRNPDLMNASDILNRELQGRQEHAAGLRSLFFPDWKPPLTNGDAAATLERVRKNLDAWAQEPGLTTSRQNRLRELRAMIERRGSTDPAAVVALIARVPLYAERLLAEPQPNR